MIAENIGRFARGELIIGFTVDADGDEDRHDLAFRVLVMGGASEMYIGELKRNGL
jgi:hypothetical protein